MEDVDTEYSKKVARLDRETDEVMRSSTWTGRRHDQDADGEASGGVSRLRRAPCRIAGGLRLRTEPTLSTRRPTREAK